MKTTHFSAWIGTSSEFLLFFQRISEENGNLQHWIQTGHAFNEPTIPYVFGLAGQTDNPQTFDCSAVSDDTYKLVAGNGMYSSPAADDEFLSNGEYFCAKLSNGTYIKFLYTIVDTSTGQIIFDRIPPITTDNAPTGWQASGFTLSSWKAR